MRTLNFLPHPTNPQFFAHSFSKHHRGSGFIAKLDVNGKEKMLLMTCHHVLPSLSAAQDSDIYFGRISDDVSATQKTGTIIKGEELFGSSFFKTDTVKVRKHDLLPATNLSALIYTPYAQADGWGERFDYTAVEVKKDVLQKQLPHGVPQPLSLAMVEHMEMTKEGLCVNDLLYIVHYPQRQQYIRCTNSERLCILKGKLAIFNEHALYFPHLRRPHKTAV